MHIINPYRYAAAGGGGGVPVVDDFTKTTIQVSSTITCTAPTGIASGKVLVLLMTSRASTYTTPSGWTLIQSANSFNASCAAFYKVSDGTETDVTVTISQAIVGQVGWYLCISGANATPIDVTGPAESSFDSSFIASSVTTTVDNCLAFYLFGFEGGDGFPFGLSGTDWTESDEGQSGTDGAASSGSWGNKEQATAGATGDATITSSTTDGGSRFQFAIAPA